MRTDMEAVARKAFMLGFMVSREGFNMECNFDHLAPMELDPSRDYQCELISIEEFLQESQNDDHLQRLCGLAMDWLKNGGEE